MFWDFLNRDVALIGSLYSPVLSWMGACGIVIFVAWQAMKLKRETATVQRAFNRVDPIVTALVKGRQKLERDRFAAHTPAPATPPQDPVRVDRDDLYKLDACMEQEPLFRGLWAQYRRTLILEQVPWFMEPRIFGTKRAVEVFSQDALFTGSMNLGFYRQLPSLITGFGLLLTFLALLIGLGKLHAEGSEIVGIQGLINGLAGKFLTSIVGLGMAQVFLFMERPLIARLASTHQKFLEHIDQIFSRKTVESLLDDILSLQMERQNTGPATGRPSRKTAISGEPDNPGRPGSDVTAAISTLLQGQQEEHARNRKSVTELPHMIRDAVQQPLQSFTTSIQELSRSLESAGRGETADLTRFTSELAESVHAFIQGQKEEHSLTRRTVTELPRLLREAMQEGLNDCTPSIPRNLPSSESTRSEKPDSPAQPTADLTAAIHTLAQGRTEEHAQIQKTLTEMPRLIREAVQGSFQKLTGSIQALSLVLEEVLEREIPGSALPATDLTSAISTMTQGQEEEHARTRKTMTELPLMIRDAVHQPLQSFTTTIQELSRTLENAGRGETTGLTQSTAELTAAVHALTQGQEEEYARIRKSVTDLPHMIGEAVQGVFQEFTISIHELVQVLKSVQPDSTPEEKAIEDRPLLWKTAAYPRDTSKENLLDKIAVWPRRQEPSKHRRTG